MKRWLGKGFGRRPGDVVLIPLRDCHYGFGQMLERGVMAFHDLRLNVVPGIDLIISAPVLFRIRVMESAIASGAWVVLGNRPIEPDLLAAPRFFTQDILTGECRIHECGIEWPANLSEIDGLECAAMWEPHHVEERLRDHFAGVPNATCEALKPARSLA